MEGKISLAWAIEVDQAQLGARLEAYVSTKAAITTLRSCLARYLLPPSVHIQNRNIPQEVIDLIADAVKDAVYIPKVQDWTRSRKCVQAQCLVLDHFKPGEFYGSLASDYAHPRNVGNGWIEEAADERCLSVTITVFAEDYARRRRDRGKEVCIMQRGQYVHGFSYS